MPSIKIDLSLRIFFSVVSVILWLGILMTGLSHVHWLLYIPAIFFTIAAIFGICPGLFISRWIAQAQSKDNEEST